jgi:hypothetical protein
VVKGLEVFRDYFAGHADQFVLIARYGCDLGHGRRRPCI